MFELIVQSTLVLLLAAVAAFSLRSQSAALVHKLWVAGLAGALAVPALTLLTPGIDILPAAFERFSAIGSGNTLRILWLAGAAVGLAIMLVGTARLARFVIGSQPVADMRWTGILADMQRRIGVHRPVQLLHHPRVRFVGTWGIWRPRVIVPSAALAWSDDRIRAVLAHELAHVARGDWPVQVLAEAARSIYWFNPVFWIVARRLRQASEHAADNVVLEMGADRAGYARELLDLSRSLDDIGRDHAPILAVTQPSFLETRLLAVLNPALNRAAATPWATLVIMLLAFVVTVPLTMVRSGRQDLSVGRSDVPVVKEVVEAAPAFAAPDIAAVSPATREEPSPTTSVRPTRPPAKPAATAPATVLALRDEPVAVKAAACPVTPSVTETPPDTPMSGALGNGPWHVNAERTIWVWDQAYTTEKFINAVWIRPLGTQLVITGERLDGVAPPIEAQINCCNSAGFKTGGIRFPTPGCWKVHATAGDQELTFVTEVTGPTRPPANSALKYPQGDQP